MEKLLHAASDKPQSILHLFLLHLDTFALGNLSFMSYLVLFLARLFSEHATFRHY